MSEGTFTLHTFRTPLRSIENLNDMSPVRKNPRGKPIGSAQKKLIMNTLKSFHVKNPTMCKTNLAQKISEEIGIGCKTVLNAGGVTSPNRTKVFPCTIWKQLEDFQKTGMRLRIHEFFRRNEIPTLDKLLHVINNDEDLSFADGRPLQFSRTSLFRVVKKLGFVYIKRKREAMLIKREEIVLWRRRYLREIRKCRRLGRPIYYLDETWINAGHTVPKKWSDGTVKSSKDAFSRGLSSGLQDPTGKGERFIILHIGNENGFVDGGLYTMIGKKTGDYHEEMNAEVFEIWLKEVLPELEPNAIIVLDNAPYHSRCLQKIPNSSWTKSQIVQRLQDEGVTADMSSLKVELLDMVCNLNRRPGYAVNEIVKSSGRNVLRLPPYHCCLNPIELAWADVKGYVARHNKTYKLADVKVLFLDALAQFTSDKWKKCVEHVINKVEKEMWDIDDIIDVRIEPVIITFSDNSDSDDNNNALTDYSVP